MEQEVTTSSENDITVDNIEDLLDNEISYNKKEKWNKLDRTLKYKKLMIYADNIDDIDENKEKLKNVLIEGLNNNKFSKISDVVYDAVNEKIISIPSLILIDNEYYLRNNKRPSTSKSLPKKSIKTKRNKDNINKI